MNYTSQCEKIDTHIILDKSIKPTTEKSWHDVNREGMDFMTLESFVSTLSWASNQFDHGFSAFIKLLENGLPIFDADENPVDSTRLIEVCAAAQKQCDEAALAEFDSKAAFRPVLTNKDGKPLVERAGFIEIETTIGNPNSHAFFEKECWTDWLAKEVRRYIVNRADVAQAFGDLGDEAFPWISREGKRVDLPVAGFIGQTQAGAKSVGAGQAQYAPTKAAGNASQRPPSKPIEQPSPNAQGDDRIVKKSTAIKALASFLEQGKSLESLFSNANKNPALSACKSPTGRGWKWIALLNYLVNHGYLKQEHLLSLVKTGLDHLQENTKS